MTAGRRARRADVIMRAEGRSARSTPAPWPSRTSTSNPLRRRQRSGRRKRRRQIDADEDPGRRRAADRRPHPARRRSRSASRALRDAAGPRHRHRLPGTEPLPQPFGRREHLRRRATRFGIDIDRAGQERLARELLARLRPHRSRASWSTICASASSRSSRSPRRWRRRARAHHGRAELGAEQHRSRDPVPCHQRPQAARRRDRLYLPSPRGDRAHRRLHHRAARRPRQGRSAGRRHRRALDHRADGRPRHRRAGATMRRRRTAAGRGVCLPRPGGGFVLDHVSLSVRAGEIVASTGCWAPGGPSCSSASSAATLASGRIV